MELIFVTTNEHKVAEAKDIGAHFGIDFVPNDYDTYEPRSQDPIEIAIASAKDAYEKIGKPLIVEDSGFFIDALKGFPGTYSAYIFNTIGVEGVLRVMEDVKYRKASMKSAVAYNDGKETKAFLGEVRGIIPVQQRGSSGFGYDPVFIPDGKNKTFAQDLDYKARTSHRAQSLKQFCEWYSQR